ncbi:MAG: hypothetical protein ABIG96_05740 [Candidatus Micrarchaeota archaeon]
MVDLKALDFDFAEFVSPRTEKIALLVTLMIVVSFLMVSEHEVGEGVSLVKFKQMGFPYGIYANYEESGLVMGEDLNNLNKIFLFGFAMDLLIWYGISCLLIYAYKRFTGKGRLGEVG